jgi:hypothetical protein
MDSLHRLPNNSIAVHSKFFSRISTHFHGLPLCASVMADLVVAVGFVHFVTRLSVQHIQNTCTAPIDSAHRNGGAGIGQDMLKHIPLLHSESV